MKKRKIFCSIILIGLVVLSGCGSLPQMTQEQENAIVEYAAGLLIKNLKDYDSRLVDLSLYNDDLKASEDKKEEENSGMDKVEDTEIIDAAEGESYDSIDELLMPQGVIITYTGYAVTDTYPEDSDGNPFFALDATQGNKLLVLQFNVVNTTDVEQRVDVFGTMSKYMVTVNGKEKKNTLSTMLLDDLSTFIGNISAGEEMPMVLLVEMEASVLEQIESIKLTVSSSAGKVTTLLQ